MVQQPITENNIEAFSFEGETQYFDRKSARKDVVEIVKHVIAFANASGGKLVIGIEDDGRVTGFKRDKAHDIEDFEQIPVTLCVPSPKVHTERMAVTDVDGEEDLVLVMDVAASPDRVIARRSDGAVALREGDRSMWLDREQIRALEYDKGQFVFEGELARRSSMDDLDSETMDRYRIALGTDLPDEQLLASRDFLADGHLTNAGVLLFSKRPTRFLPCARVRVLKIDGTEMGSGAKLNIVKDRTFEGPIPKVVDEAGEMISTLLREFQFLGGEGLFRTVPEYPEFAWFEGLINAIVHRDYSIAGDYIRMSLFDDRMEIFSPGQLPDIVTLENMKTVRYSRNPHIARTLVEFGWVRELNEGVGRMFEEMHTLGLPDPEYSEPGGVAVKLVLRNNLAARIPSRKGSAVGGVSQEIMESLSENEKTAMRLAMTGGKITTRLLADAAGISRQTAATVLKGLQGKGILDWHGHSSRDPSQHYTVH